MINKKIAIIGAGGWGTALSIVLASKFNVILWCNEKETFDEISMNRTNTDFLPNVELPMNITPVEDFSAIKDADVIINTVPTQFIRTVYSQWNFSIEDKIFINGAKGVERNSLYRISEVFTEVLNVKPSNYAILSGPSHAEEVSNNVPTAVVCASANMQLAQYVRDNFSTKQFRVYSSSDVIGTELGGAMKNVIAIAFGIADALNFGDNTKAMVITRGLAEIARLGIACGANPQTLGGLSGLGDLIVTCYSKHSRNRHVGQLLGKGMKISEIKKQSKTVAEGVETAASALQLAQKLEVEIPITQQVYDVIYQDKEPKDAVNELLTRESKNELW